MAPRAAEAFKSQYRGAPLPAHTGYEQLAIILEKSKRLDEAIDLCKKAAHQGWAGDWQKRIGRCEKRLKR